MANTCTKVGMTVHDLVIVRAAILDVIDDGDQCGRNCDMKHGWIFDPQDESSSETERRMRFADAVQKRILELSNME